MEDVVAEKIKNKKKKRIEGRNDLEEWFIICKQVARGGGKGLPILTERSDVIYV